MRRFGGMVSFLVAEGDDAALKVCDRAEVFTLAESLGGVESLVELPSAMTHASVAGSALEVPGNLIRLSVGLESLDDLIDDLRALARRLSRGPGLLRRLRVDVHQGRTRRHRDRQPDRVGEHPTTLDTDVLDAWDVLRARAAASANLSTNREIPVLACSSAGGGLRIAVVGNEELVTSEAGRRVALSSGGRVVHLSFDEVDVAALGDDAPDVVLLVGGTDGGNAEVLLHNAKALAKARWRAPVVVAGNAEAQSEISALLGRARVPFVLADNVVPQIGVLRPEGARSAIREMFLSHVIGGKHLSKRADFRAMVQGATPDVVLTAVELLAAGLDLERPGVGDVVVVDVGGATTDVHSVVAIDPEEAGLAREVVATVPVSRTVEGDLGMRWSAVPTVEARGVRGHRRGGSRRGREAPTDRAVLPAE